MSEFEPSAAELARANEELREQLEEAHELIHAIRTGAVDALAVQSAEGPRIFTLQGADQSYRTLIEQMNEGALLLAEDATVLYCNASLADLLRCPLAEVMGRSFDEFVPPGFKQIWAALMLKGWASKSRGELPLRTQTGVLLPFSVSMNVLEFNETPVLAVIVTDLSAQREITAIRAQVAEQNALLDRKNEELKREEAARLAGERAAAEASRVLEGIPQIAWTANPQGFNTYLNRRWFDYIGRENAVGSDQGWDAHLHPDDRPASGQRWRECLASGEPYEVEYRFRNRAGDYRWMLGRALPSRNTQGEIIQWIGTCTDIHEQKLALERIDQAQQQLRDNNEQLTRANVDLDNFIYTASHDLRAPISNIEGLLDALLLELPAATTQSEEVHPLLDLMQDSVNRFKRTIEHLTEVSRLQKEHGGLAVPVDLAAVVHDVRLDLEPVIQSTEAQLDVDVQATTVLFSEKNLRSVVFNLLSNALKYRAPNRSPHVRLRTWTEAGGVVLEVSDNGLGLDAAYTDRLFGMFQRFHDHVEGSGIGLYMVKKMVENAGGRIAVKSTLGVGSVFSVYFTN
ncbi:PAS domain-containing protein [Microvirga sp. STS02]|uniref:ATP-binding protein n=1 Tax=Hymenobacter negativus TaxID=2795026 RepID=UPI0018DE92A9|nr:MULTISPECIES: ATP-binding protein [Bacteria]MBH8568593.1 PAS domain-containing protein [Hymenobacter negativus]MBR7208327.1 PAS domain-containing protein [Microvirga sp. STS02]